MKDLIQTIAQSLVDHSEEVSVQEIESERAINYQLSVHPDDMGQIIGKQGRIAKAMRTVVYAAGSSSSKRIYVDIK